MVIFMLIRFVVLTKSRDYEVTGSYLLDDKEILSNVLNQALPETEKGTYQFYVLDTETLKVDKVDMEEE